MIQWVKKQMTMECFQTVKYREIARWQTEIKKHRHKRTEMKRIKL